MKSVLQTFKAVAPINDNPTNLTSSDLGKDIYKLVKSTIGFGSSNRGILVEAAAKAFETKNENELVKEIKKQILPYLYEDVREIDVKDLVERRNEFRRRKRNEAEKVDNKWPARWRWGRQDSFFSASFHFKDTGAKRRCFWDVNKRGFLGETVLHLCLLNNTQVHNYLAKVLIRTYPNLLLDIYLSDEYYGENALHMAVANEDFEMVKFILKIGKEIDLDLEERCYGSFFGPIDQKKTRRDQIDSEIISVDEKTNYKSDRYWGEHSLAFAACFRNEQIFEALLSAGADINCVDVNGNNILHLLVINGIKEMFSLVCNKNTALLEVKNKQLLTPLTLAAKLANKSMLDHIMNAKRLIEWQYGNVVCFKYQLTNVDTIDSENGNINARSALSIIVNASSTSHLEMLDGLLYQILQEKWKGYGKKLFYLEFLRFILYLFVFVPAVLLQPDPDPTNQCYLLESNDAARFVFEISVLIGVLIHLAIFIKGQLNQTIEGSLGVKSFLDRIYGIKNAPMKASFIFSCFLILAILPFRFTCNTMAETVLLTLAILTCLPYLLFFCRGFKLVGSFVFIIYRMVIGDMFRFMIIYITFLAAFSQAMFIMFRGRETSFFAYPFQSALAMFILTMGEFDDIYSDFDNARSPLAVKGVFVIYIVLVTLLLINMLIAMMTGTFNRVTEAKWEWQRQWASIILVLEHSVDPKTRKEIRKNYSVESSHGPCFVTRHFKKKQLGSSEGSELFS